MADNSSVMFGLSWSEVSVCGGEEFGQASMEGCTGNPPLCRPHILEVRLCWS